VAYGLTLLTLGLAALLLARATWLSSEHVGVAVIAGVLAWLIGHLQAARRIRLFAFGPDPGQSLSGDAPAPDGSPG
jgi:hypothetical protein